LVTLLAACGGDDGDSKPTPDAPPSAATVALVDPCPASPDATITTKLSAFDPPATTITQGQVVKFVSTPTHPVKAKAGTDPKLAVPENATRCFRFTSPGAYTFECTTHNYSGSITVN
ncbi:MAG TPA: hypothetical protein VK427_18195, partial [Kofleriaceae bacterium]|nr:hypothetical protein [Kofleriaceae bacterium]